MVYFFLSRDYELKSILFESYNLGESMGNIVSFDKCGQNISMSNGLTSVFISSLGLSGTHLAKTDDEKQIIIWLLEKDQSAVGIGSVGFDVCDMPWNNANFDNIKCFLLNVIEGAKKKIGWEFLDYKPSEELLFPCLDQFYCCKKHSVFLTVFGCHLCND